MNDTIIYLTGITNILTIALFFALLFVIGTMGNNIRKIRILLEDEADQQRQIHRRM